MRYPHGYWIVCTLKIWITDMFELKLAILKQYK